MAELITTRTLSGSDPMLAPLVVEAEATGFRFMRRLVDEWTDGANRFDRPGEILLGVYEGVQLAGVGGLNRDPFADDDRIARVRHVYVLAAARRRGTGGMLIGRLLDHAAARFALARLRTDTMEGAAFYQALGFVPTTERDATHRIDL